jgi:hypothetical protein
MARESAADDRARKEVRFVIEEINRHDLKKDTPLRRRSSAIHDVPLNQAEPLVAEDDEDAEPATIEKFTRDVTTQLPDVRYTETRESLVEDLRAKLVAFADHFAGKYKDKAPAMPFTRMVDDDPKKPDAMFAGVINGTVNATEFADLAARFPDEVFKEVKMRGLLTAAYAEQVEELHTIAKDLDRNLKYIHDWVPIIADNLKTTHDADLNSRTEEVVGLNQIIADLMMQAREGTVATHHSIRSTETASGGSKGRSAKQPDPPIFLNDGAKDTTTFETWYRNLQNKLAANGDHFSNDAARQGYIEGRVGGKAARELAPYLRETHPDVINTSEKLMAHLWSEYNDPLQSEKSLTDFIELEMKPGDSFTAFKNDFVRLAGECGKSKVEWKAEFKRRLPGTLQRALAPSYLDPAVTFDQYVRLGAEISHSYRQTGNGHAPRRDGAPRAAKTPKISDPRPAAPKAKSPAPQLSPEEVRKLYDEGRCFVCREKGHTSRECPQKTGGGAAAGDWKAQRESRIANLQSRWAAKEPAEEPATPRAPASNKKKLAKVVELPDSASDSEN